MSDLSSTISDLVIPGKGILAADESAGTIKKRFDSIHTESTEENRQAYRSLLCTTAGLEEFVSGVILFEETLTQTDSHGTPLPQVLAEKGIVPGIKVDKGLSILPNTDEETITQGLDGLADRLAQYKTLGARFAKWRNVYKITDTTPSMTAVRSGAEVLARYASICQNEGIVPIVEPELLMEGEHDIELCAEITEIILNEVFRSLFQHQVELNHIVLKPNMVLPGKGCEDQSNPNEIAQFTLAVFRNNVPASVPSINFLSGGQSPEEATRNLNAINAVSGQPWQLSFSYGRALQEPCLKAWQGDDNNKQEAQRALFKRAKLNGAAVLGQYSESLERES